MMKKIILAVPKGRILEELEPLLKKIAIIPEAEFFNEKTRKLTFSTNFSNLEIIKIRSFDLDPSCISIAEVFNKPWVAENWNFKSITENILDIDYTSHSWTSWSSANNRMSNPITDVPNTIINTSCEHIENFDKWYNLIPKNKIVILQTNNYIEIEDHVNCSSNLEEFRVQTPMTTVLYEGE